MRLRVLSAGADTPEVGVSSRIYVAVEAPFPTGPVAVPYLVAQSYFEIIGKATMAAQAASAAGTVQGIYPPRPPTVAADG